MQTLRNRFFRSSTLLFLRYGCLYWSLIAHCSKNNVSEHIVERTDMTDSLISSAPGTEVFRQTELRVPPVLHHPEQEIRDASQRFIQQHSTRFPMLRILMQV